MKEIKFRAKTLYAEENRFVYGLPVYEIGGGLSMQVKSENGFLQMLGVDPETLSQFTGLYDKNTKEIYEGDILESKRQYKYMYDAGYRGHVVAREYYADYEYGMFGGQITQAKAKYCEIIGNIHENPELLKE